MNTEEVTEALNGWAKFSRAMESFLTMLHSAMCGNYMVVITILLVVLLSFLLPDISQKLQATQELKDMKTVVRKISSQVKKAEVACLTVADHISCLYCTIHKVPKASSKDGGKFSIYTTDEVRSTQSEPKIGYARRNSRPIRNTSNKEIALMSYLYTDSFNK